MFMAIFVANCLNYYVTNNAVYTLFIRTFKFNCFGIEKKAMTYFNFGKNAETHRSVVKKFDRSPSDFARLLDHRNVDVEYEKYEKHRIHSKHSHCAAFSSNSCLRISSFSNEARLLCGISVDSPLPYIVLFV